MFGTMASNVVEVDVFANLSDLIRLDDSVRDLDFLSGFFQGVIEEVVGGLIGGLVSAFDEDPDGGLAFEKIVFDSLAEGRIENAFER